MQVVERVLKAMLGTGHAPAPRRRARRTSIVVAHDLSPADMILFKQHQFAGFVTDLGGVTSHTAIVARSLDIPAIVGLHHARQLIREDELLIVDGVARRADRRSRPAGARRIPAAPARVRARAAEAQAPPQHARDHARRRRGRAAGQHRAAAGRRAGARSPARPASACSAASSCSSTATTCPTRTSSSRPTARSAQAMDGMPVTIRTLDLGADKTVNGAPERGPEPGAGPARDPLLPGRAADVPDAAARDPARVRTTARCAC